MATVSPIPVSNPTMIRRLIILLLIVGCEDEEEPKGLCTFFKGTGDTLTAMSFLDSTFN